MARPLSHTSFGGATGEECNALRSALATAAKDMGHEGQNAEYAYLEQAPTTSLVVELVDALHRHGYAIREVE